MPFRQSNLLSSHFKGVYLYNILHGSYMHAERTYILTCVGSLTLGLLIAANVCNEQSITVAQIESVCYKVTITTLNHMMSYYNM